MDWKREKRQVAVMDDLFHVLFIVDAMFCFRSNFNSGDTHPALGVSLLLFLYCYSFAYCHHSSLSVVNEPVGDLFLTPSSLTSSYWSSSTSFLVVLSYTSNRLRSTRSCRRWWCINLHRISHLMSPNLVISFKQWSNNCNGSGHTATRPHKWCKRQDWSGRVCIN